MSLTQRQAILDALPADGLALEWGGGGTSLWLAQRLRPGQRLVTVEHDATWYGRLLSESDFDSWTVKWFACDHVGENATPFEECPSGAAAYVNPVDLHDPDVFVIDGIARGACLAAVVMNARPGATVFLHDAQRRWYDWAVKAAGGLLADARFIEPEEGGYPARMWSAVVR